MNLTLGELCRPKQWKTLRKADLDEHGHPVYGANGIIGYYSKYTHEKPTILVGCRGSCGSLMITKPFAYANGNAMALDDLREDLVDIKYLYWFLSHRGFANVITGTSQPQITGVNIRRIQIPLPPLPEQRRIAAILDQADALRAKRRQAIAKLDALLQSVFLEMFGDPVTNPKGWPVTTLAEAADFYAGNSLPASTNFTGQVDGFLALKVGDMNRPGNEEYIASAGLWRKEHAKGAVLCPVDAIIIPKRGGAIGTNKKRVLKRKAYLDPNLMGIHAREIGTRYLFSWFQSFDLASITSGSSVPQLNKRDLAPLPIAIPPKDVQRRFEEMTDAILIRHARAKEAAVKTDNLSAALSQRFFA